MEYSIFKMEFNTGVHFGRGMLNDSANTFSADMLFSALYIEALRMGMEQKLYRAVKDGRLLFSDSFPYAGNQYMLPKPMIYVEHANQGSSVEKKRYKALKYIPAEQMDLYLSGRMDLDTSPMEDVGYFAQQTMAAVRGLEETAPFRVGTFYYNQGNGLYVIMASAGEEETELAEELMESLSYTGIGGKKYTGLGKFKLKRGIRNDALLDYLTRKTGRYMLISTALPRDEELDLALQGASYLLTKRSGFVASSTYAEELRRKRDLYMFAPGSCFENAFSGDIFDVSDNGRHPVYRSGKALFMEV